MSILYTAHATSTAGRDGHVETDDKKLSFDLGRPGSNDKGTNPEQLFACGYAACFGSAIGSVAKAEKVEVGEVKVASDVSLNQDEAKGYYLNVALAVTLSGTDDATAKRLVEKAHTVCPYSKATRGNIEVTLTANGQALDKAAA